MRGEVKENEIYFLVCSFDKKSYTKTTIPSFWQDLFYRKVFPNGKVGDVDPITFLVT